MTETDETTFNEAIVGATEKSVESCGFTDVTEYILNDVLVGTKIIENSITKFYI